MLDIKINQTGGLHSSIMEGSSSLLGQSLYSSQSTILSLSAISLSDSSSYCCLFGFRVAISCVAISYTLFRSLGQSGSQSSSSSLSGYLYESLGPRWKSESTASLSGNWKALFSAFLSSKMGFVKSSGLYKYHTRMVAPGQAKRWIRFLRDF